MKEQNKYSKQYLGNIVNEVTERPKKAFKLQETDHQSIEENIEYFVWNIALHEAENPSSRGMIKSTLGNKDVAKMIKH